MKAANTQAVEVFENRAGDLLMGADAIAGYLGVTRRQVYRLVYDDIIPSFKLGGTVAARRSSLTKWMEQLEEGQNGS
ncbi:helix-turn-helix domain-containing protein [Rhizobium sp. WW_1]|jgi:excisionase family DNA binding protein|uniref:helix-turn-helix domain-containing protein n=1 Tax=Rhizobium sp. WW_1 TaxID=1907375 RepID=UPI000645FB21|nr:helix-turn-helix domain-containing protein [Rhizobium sp. WW_1]RKD61694.1 excisionase family DNA binding protein [Rhizobium sp. WW_1]